MTWKVNDMCFFEFSLSKVKEVEGDNITEVSDGYFSTSTGGSFNDRCFPVTLEMKLIADEYNSWSKEIHKKGLSDLNFPDIHRWLVNHWAVTCTMPDKREWLTERYKELTAFAKEILDKCQETRQFVLSDGTPLLRHRFNPT